MAQDEGGRPQDWVIEVLADSRSNCPEELLEEVMADARCAAFGPIHHFVVGAVLLACARSSEGGPEGDARLRADLEELATRAGCVPGAACAKWGVCGAAASAGMAYAILRESAPLRREGWSEGQLLVTRLLGAIARAGSPRCCKRDARIAVREAVDAFDGLPGVSLRRATCAPVCATAPENSVCLGERCPFHPSEG